MFHDDHDPPHFHIWTPDLEMMVLLADLSTLRGNLRKHDYEIAMAWACSNLQLLRETSGASSMTEDDEMIEVGRPLPRIAKAEPLEDRKVRLWWRGAAEPIVVDVAPALAGHRGFIALRTDDKLFRSFKVSEYGDCLEWPDDIELAAVWIERLADAALDNAQFRAAMDEMHMSLDGMAAHLGVSRRLIADYRKDKPIPKMVALATRYLLDQRKVG